MWNAPPLKGGYGTDRPPPPLLIWYYYYICLTAFFQDNLYKPAPERQTILDFTKATDDGVAVASAMEIICTSLQTDNHLSTSPLSFYRSDALPATQQTASKYLGLSVTFLARSKARRTLNSSPRVVK